MVLVDTSVLIHFLKGTDNDASRAFAGIPEGHFCITPVVMQEVLQGAKTEHEFVILRDYLSTQLFCYPMHLLATYQDAAKLFFDARRLGVTIRSTLDCLIAQIAIENGVALLHDDRDFDALARVSKLKIWSYAR
jgi:predicted nucleic acid-binding protein